MACLASTASLCQLRHDLNNNEGCNKKILKWLFCVNAIDAPPTDMDPDSRGEAYM